MASYPSSIYSPRDKENKSGVVYDAAKKTVIFVEDVSKLDDEVVAIETELGTNPKGIYATVKAWLEALTSAIAGKADDPHDNEAHDPAMIPKNTLTTKGDLAVAVGPVAHYKLNEDADNTNIVDSEGIQSAGTASQNTDQMSVAGKINKAISFNGTSDYIDLGAIQTLTDYFVWTFWYKPLRLDETQVLAHLRDAASGSRTYVAQFDSNKFRFRIRTGTIKVTSLTLSVGDVGKWFFFVVIYDASGARYYIYDDAGNLLELDTIAVGTATDAPTNFSLGANRQALSSYNECVIDDFRIFQKLSSGLTPDEIAKIYNSGNGIEDMLPVVRRLPIGTNGQRLQADSSEPAGMKWVTP